jgi:hypothetical protein
MDRIIQFQSYMLDARAEPRSTWLPGGFTSVVRLASVSHCDQDAAGANHHHEHVIDTSISTKDLLFTLLLKVGVAASFAALLARWTTFRRVLFTEERDPDQKLKLMIFMTPPIFLWRARS